MINTGLPVPGDVSLLNAIETADSIDIKAFYSIVATGGGFWVARTFDNNLIIKAVDGTLRTLANPTSNAYESNLFVNQGSLYFISKRGTQLFLEIINLTNNSLISEQYLVDDAGFASLTPDFTNNRLIIFKSQPGSGTPSNSWIFSVDLSSFALTVHHNNPTDASYNDVTVHIFENAGVYYRSYRSTTDGKIVRMTQTVLDNQFYELNPVAGESVIQNVNSDDLYWPVFADNKVFVLSEDAARFSVWDAIVPNTQLVSPFVIDARVGLHHATSKIQYDRFQLDASNNVLFDTRTFFAWNTVTNTEVTDRYPLCINETVNNIYSIDVSDRQPVRLFETVGTLSFFRVVQENFLYNLNSNSFCPIAAPQQSQQQHIAPGARSLPGFELNELVGTITSTVAGTEAIYQDDFLTVTALGMTSLRINGATFSLGEDVFSLSKIEFNNNYIVRTSNDFRIYNGLGTETVLAAAAITGQSYSFIFSNEYYVISDNNISILNLDTNAVTDFTVIFDRPDRVRLFVNPFENELYLFDRDAPNELRIMNFVPRDFDFTDATIIPIYSNLLLDNFSNQVDKTTASANWGLTQVGSRRILYIDYDNSVFESILERTVSLIGSVNVRGIIEPGSTITSIGTLIFDRNLSDIISLRDSPVIPQTDFILDSIGAPNLALTPAPDSRIAPYVNAQGFLTFLAFGVIGGDSLTVYNLTFDRSFIADEQFNFTEDTLSLQIRDGANGQYLIDEFISQKELISYNISPKIIINASTSNDGSKVAIEEAKEVLYQAQIVAVLNTDKLRNLLNIFYQQWRRSSESQLWEVFLNDLIYEQNSNTLTNRAIIPSFSPSPTTNYVRYNVAITAVDYRWYSDEKYQISITLEEIATNIDSEF